jgi:hypothetical protein
MNNTQRVALTVVSIVLVALGLFLIRGDDSDTDIAAATSPGEPRRDVAPEPMTTRPPTALAQQPTEAPSPVAAHEPQEKDSKVELAPSPFESPDSPELQYAVKLVLGENTGPNEWRKAAEVFQRCVDQNPTNHLCKRGVYAAWERIDSDGGQATALTNTGPLTVDPAQLKATDRPNRIIAPLLQESGRLQ